MLYQRDNDWSGKHPGLAACIRNAGPGLAVESDTPLNRLSTRKSERGCGLA